MKCKVFEHQIPEHEMSIISGLVMEVVLVNTHTVNNENAA